jgi:RIO kinase 2
VTDDEGRSLALKLHRLGRTSFRNVKKTRDYLRSRTASYNWLHLSHLSALKEFAFMRALGEHGFPVPLAVETNRHCVLMSLVEAHPLTQVRSLAHPAPVWAQALGIMSRLARHGLVHCDFNEFNLLVDEGEALTLIDFPQMVSTRHANAAHFYERDVDCLRRFFVRRYNFRPDDAGLDDGSGGLAAALGGVPPAGAGAAAGGSAGGGGDGDGVDAGAGFQQLDEALRASGYGAKEQAELEAALEEGRLEGRREGDESSSGSDEDGEESDDTDDAHEVQCEDESEYGYESEELPARDGDDASPSHDAEDEADVGGMQSLRISQRTAASEAAAASEARLHAQRLERAQRAAADAEAAGVRAGAAGGSDDEAAPPASEIGDRAATVSVSIGLSARQQEVRERIRLERKKASKAAAMAGAKVNHSKDKTGSRKATKGGSSSAATDSFWG